MVRTVDSNATLPAMMRWAPRHAVGMPSAVFPENEPLLPQGVSQPRVVSPSRGASGCRSGGYLGDSLTTVHAFLKH